MTTSSAPRIFSVLALVGAVVLSTQASAQIPTPEEFFGHRMGADRKLAKWDRLVEYYELIGAESDRVLVENVGSSTLGRPFLVLYVSSPENLARLDDYQRMNAVLQDPRGHSQDEIDAAIADGKVAFLQGYALHRTRWRQARRRRRSSGASPPATIPGSTRSSTTPSRSWSPR